MSSNMHNSVIVKRILIAVAIVALFIPTVMAFVYYYSGDGTVDGISLDILDKSGAVIDIADTDDTKEVVYANALYTAIKNMTKLSVEQPSDINPERHIIVSLTVERNSYKYECSLSKDFKTAYFRDIESGVYYRLKEDKTLTAFFGSPYTVELYTHASGPVLKTSAEDKITPQTARWYYKVYSPTGELQTARSNIIALTANKTEYIINKELGLSFDILPDIFNITVYDEDKVVFEGAHSDFLVENINEALPLEYHVKAEWINSNSADYYGEFEYVFTTFLSEPPSFKLESDSIQSGEFTVISGKNVTSISKIKLTCNTDLAGFSPVFYADGDYVRAPIPVDLSIEVPCTIEFTVSCSGTESILKLSVTERIVQDNSPRDYKTAGIGVARNEQTLSEYLLYKTNITKTSASDKYFGDRFLDYENKDILGATIYLGFGRYRKNEDGEVYRLDGVDYMISKGVNVKALNSGKVVYTGQCALLGYFVVIDHGFGIKTWYCHLGQILTTEETVIAKGEVVGTTGRTGYTNSDGLYLITTVGNIPVSPYPLIEKGVVMTTWSD